MVTHSSEAERCNADRLLLNALFRIESTIQVISDANASLVLRGAPQQ